jgi:hypothetical protein
VVIWASDAGVVVVSGVVLAGVAVVWVLGTALDVVSREVVAGTATVVSSDVAAVVDSGGGMGGAGFGSGGVDGCGGVLVGLCCFGLAVDGGYSTISADDGATVVSDVARVVGPLTGSEGVSGAAGGRGVASEGVCSFVWAVDGGFSTDCADGAATVVSDVARVVWLLGGSSGGWGVCRDVVSRLGGVYRRF